MAKMNYEGFEYEGTPDELFEIRARLTGNKPTSGDANLRSEQRNGSRREQTWHWTDEAVADVVEHVWGSGEKVLRAFADHGRELKYKELCKYTGLRGLSLVGPLSAIKKFVQNAVGNRNAKLIDRRWTIPGNRDERIYYIHPDAWDALRKIMKGKAA